MEFKLLQTKDIGDFFQCHGVLLRIMHARLP